MFVLIKRSAGGLFFELQPYATCVQLYASSCRALLRTFSFAIGRDDDDCPCLSP